MTTDRPIGAFSPARVAADLTHMLDKVLGPDRYPVDVEVMLLEVSRARYPDDPVLKIVGDDLPGFEGALMPVGRPRRGWSILYSTRGNTAGRRRFTVAHEAGHYFLHRRLRPEGIQCDAKAITRRDGEGIEREADRFAADLLMPFHDLRRQLPATARPSLARLSSLADRYGVSLTALVLRWLEYTERRSLMVVSREGYALWAHSSHAAARTGLFIRTSETPFELPPASLTVKGATNTQLGSEAPIPAGVWFAEPVHESVVAMERFDKVLTVLHFGDRHRETFDEGPDLLDAFEMMKARNGER